MRGQRPGISREPRVPLAIVSWKPRSSVPEVSCRDHENTMLINYSCVPQCWLHHGDN